MARNPSYFLGTGILKTSRSASRAQDPVEDVVSPGSVAALSPEPETRLLSHGSREHSGRLGRPKRARKTLDDATPTPKKGLSRLKIALALARL